MVETASHRRKVVTKTARTGTQPWASVRDVKTNTPWTQRIFAFLFRIYQNRGFQIAKIRRKEIVPSVIQDILWLKLACAFLLRKILVVQKKISKAAAKDARRDMFWRRMAYVCLLLPCVWNTMKKDNVWDVLLDINQIKDNAYMPAIRGYFKLTIICHGTGEELRELFHQSRIRVMFATLAMHLLL